MAARSYAVLGTGALGGIYGARLHHAGLDVHFLLRSDLAHVREHGLRVESVDGDFSIERPKAYGAAAELPPCDVAMVCLKTTANAALPELLPPALARDGVVLVMQNGLGVDEQAAAAAPGHVVVGGLAFLCSNKVGPGHVRHLDFGDVWLGQHTPDGSAAGVTDVMRAVAADFEKAGVGCRLEPDLALARWKKLVWNTTFNGLCALRDQTTDVLMADPHERALCEAVMREVVGAAAACGHGIEPAFVDEMLELTASMTAYAPSMLLDRREGRPLETSAIYDAPLAAARAAGCECPRIREIRDGLVALARDT